MDEVDMMVTGVAMGVTGEDTVITKMTIEEVMATTMTEGVTAIDKEVMTIVIKEVDITTNKGEVTIITIIIGGIEVDTRIEETDNMTMVVMVVVAAVMEVEEVTEVEINQGAMQILV